MTGAQTDRGSKGNGETDIAHEWMSSEKEMDRNCKGRRGRANESIREQGTIWDKALLTHTTYPSSFVRI